MQNITWDSFKYFNTDNKPVNFENMCRLLFKLQFCSATQVLHVNPNNPGIEVEPVPRLGDNKKVSYQSKFFDKKVDHNQIEDSMEKAVKHYKGRLDVIYLYSNETVTTTSKSYIKIAKYLEYNGIEIIPICNQAVLDTLILYQYEVSVQNIIKTYFPPNNTTYAAFGEALRTAKKAGVKIVAVDCKVTENSMDINNFVKVWS